MHVQVMVVLETLDEELPLHSVLVDGPLCPPSQAALGRGPAGLWSGAAASVAGVWRRGLRPDGSGSLVS